MQIQDELPKSRITLRYPTSINGQKENKELPLRLLFIGDLSKGTSKDRKQNFEDRKVRNLNTNGINSILKDLNIKLNLDVLNKIDPKNQEKLNINLDIDNINSFSPEQIADNVPKIKSLLLIKKLLLELVSLIDNKKDFKRSIVEIYKQKDKIKILQQTLSKYENLKLPR